MVKIYRDADNRINMVLEQDELNTLTCYMAVGDSSRVESFAEENNISIPSFIEQTPLFEAIINYVKNK